MPARPRNKKHNLLKKQMPGKSPPSTIIPETPKNMPVAVATVVPPELKPSPALATQPAPRHNYVGKELLRVMIVTTIVLAILVVLFLVLR